MEEIWIEKYRPTNLSEVVGQSNVTDRLKNYVKERSMPHLLFAGPAGIGVASLLSQSDLNHLILDKSEIGNSFLDWPKNMEMITPSFPSNAFGQMDLNSIFESTSPAFAFNKEHLTGDEYAIYLSGVADYRALNVEKNNEVKSVSEEENGWAVVCL